MSSARKAYRQSSKRQAEWGEQPTLVFVRDKYYGWLPGELVFPVRDGDKTASVVVTLPPDWHDFTANSSHPSLQLDIPPDEAPPRIVKLADYVGSELPRQNVDKDKRLVGKSDMADLPFLHEAAILYNLKDRHIRGVPYTRVGDIVVAMNPFKWIDGLYSEEKRDVYADRLIWNVDDLEADMSNRQTAMEGYFDRIAPDPHVYETSSQAYRGLAVDRTDQAILVSGESGAGKTETVKIVMRHLATVQNTRPTADSMQTKTGIVEKVLESNPVFEAFGNAKTVRNDNSSRFGKFTKLWYEIEDYEIQRKERRDVPIAVFTGSSCETYLLEKARVVGHSGPERTYHIFYQLLAAPEEFKASLWDGLSGATPESFRSVGTPDSNVIDGKTDAQSWEETKAALDVFGINGEKMRSLMQALCIVLQMGNLEFSPDPSDEELTLIASSEELSKLADLMGVDSVTIQNAMTTRYMKTRGEEFTVKLTIDASRDSRDALAKEIYAHLFDMLVKTINESTSPNQNDLTSKDKNFRSISLLDLFGFEVFEVNRFEQLCINYANERLQQKYVADNFRAAQEEYDAEGIELYDFSSVDNSDVIELVEGRMGLIKVLNEECIRPKGNDSSFVYKVKTIHKDSDRLVSGRLDRPWEFGVNHFAGPVKYDATKFVERNWDKLPKDLLECACECSNDIIRTGFERLLEEACKQEQERIGGRRGAARNTICTKFKSQLTGLMANLEDAKTRFIRCIKPNNEKKSRIVDHELTMRQLGSAGLVTAITISRETFPNRLSYDAVWDRFYCLSPPDVDISGAVVKEKASLLLAALLEGKEKVVGGHVITPYACGKTKIFFRSGSLELLESDRMRLYNKKATVLQRFARSFITHRWYQVVRAAVVKLQACFRRQLARVHYTAKRMAALVLECWARGVLARREQTKRKKVKIVTKIQSRWRARKEKQSLSKFKEAVAVIQRAIKSNRNRSAFESSMAIIVEEARKDNEMKMLRMKIAEVSKTSDNYEVLRDCDSMIAYLAGELYRQRGFVSDLRAEVANEKANASRLKVRAENAEAASAASLIRATSAGTHNKRLSTKFNEQKESTVRLRGKVKELQSTHDLLRLDKEAEILEMRHSHNLAVAKLERELAETRENHKLEVSRLKVEHQELVESVEEDKENLKRELQETQETHNEDMAKMLEALDTAHETSPGSFTKARNIETKTSDDLEIEELRKKIEELNSIHESQMTDLNSSLSKRQLLRTKKGLPIASSLLPTRAGSAPEIDEIDESLLDRAADCISTNVEVKDRRFRLKSFEQCFIGAEAVDALVTSDLAESREEAVAIGQSLQSDRNVFEHVSGDYDFKDEYLFYRFA